MHERAGVCAITCGERLPGTRAASPSRRPGQALRLRCTAVGCAHTWRAVPNILEGGRTMNREVRARRAARVLLRACCCACAAARERSHGRVTGTCEPSRREQPVGPGWGRQVEHLSHAACEIVLTRAQQLCSSRADAGAPRCASTRCNSAPPQSTRRFPCPSPRSGGCGLCCATYRGTSILYDGDQPKPPSETTCKTVVKNPSRCQFGVGFVVGG